MTSYQLVMPEHMNHYGFLFGGNLLKWVDEIAWMAVSQDYPDGHFVTIGMDQVVFKKSVTLGSILRFEIHRIREGNTSVQYSVEVCRRELHATGEDLIFHTDITFVRVNDEGKNVPLH